MNSVKKSEFTHSVPRKAVSYLVNAAGMSSEANEKHSWEKMMEHFTVIMLKINSDYLLVWLAYSTEVTF